MVSTSAPTAAATIGATSENINGGRGVTDDRVQHASATPATEPNTKKAVVPAMVFSPFHGSVVFAAFALAGPKLIGVPSSEGRAFAFHARPISVANPSPNASTPHAAATMSSRSGNARIRMRTDNG